MATMHAFPRLLLDEETPKSALSGFSSDSAHQSDEDFAMDFCALVKISGEEYSLS